jgi:serine/threonine-protein kinase
MGETSIPEDGRWLGIAVAIADGSPIDWNSTPSDESKATGSASSSVVARLQALERLVRGHEAIRTSAFGVYDARDTILTEASRKPPLSTTQPLEVHWGPLVVIDKIGRGSFGDVYRAWDPRLDREVALKLIPEIASDAEASPVVEEGRLLARVRHPNVLTVYGAERIDGRVGIWTELIDGETLAAEVSRRGALEPQEAARIGVDVCRALEAVHRAGLLHRDVKAQNIFRDSNGRLVLGDFGTGIETNEKAAVTEPQIAGTPLYLAPEVIEHGPPSIGADLYSVGVLLYFLVTADYPVRGRTLAEIRQEHAAGRSIPLRTKRPDVPERFADVADGLLTRGPDRRYGSASAVAAALEACVVTSSDAPGPAKAGHYDRRPLWLAAAALLVIAATIGGISMWRARNASSAREDEANEAGRAAAPSRVAGFAFVHVAAELERLVNFHRLAPDGVHATCTGGGAELSVCNLQTGAIRPVRVKKPRSLEGSQGPLLSPDGRQVVYLWTTDRGQTYSLRLINVDGTGERELLPHKSDSAIVRLEHWTRDGDAVLIKRRAKDGAYHFAVVPIDGVAPETPLDFNLGNDPWDLSPDERLLVGTKAAPGTAVRDLVIRDRNGHESWLLQTASDEESAGWTPDGKAVVFMSNALGGLAVFMVRVENGRAIAAPQLVQDFGRSTAWFRGYSDTGSLLVQLVTHWVDAFRARVDLETGTLTGLERLEPRSSSEDTASPDWDPSGQRYALVGGAIARSPMLKARIMIRHSDGRLEKEVLLPGRIERGARLRWSPNGRYLAVLYTPDSGNSSAIDVIDIDGDTRRRVVEKPGGAQNFPAGQFAWSSDSAAIYYLQERTLRRREIASGHTTVVSNLSGVFDVAPDGTIAVATQDRAGCAVRILRDEKTYERHRFRGDCTSLAWSRDGRKLLVGALTSRAYADLWSMNADGGEPLYIRAPTELIGNLSLGPDGSSLLFSAGNPWPEFWLISGIGRRAASTSVAGSKH